MEAGDGRYLAAGAMAAGVVGLALLASAFGGDIEAIFGARDRRFAVLVLITAALAAATASELVGLVLGTTGLLVLLVQSYPGMDVDIPAYRFALLFILLFNVGLGASRRFERRDRDWRSSV